MNLKLFTLVLLTSLNLQAQEKITIPLMDIYKTLENRMTDINFQGFNIDLKKKIIKYHSFGNNFYLQIQRDHNGKPLYYLTYKFNLKNVQAYFKKLQRTP